MDPIDLMPFIELLDDNIDDLEDALSPLLESSLADIAGKMPLLDKAQLYVLATFAIESLLFSYLRLNEIDAKQHPVFSELARVNQYFAKITEAESGGSKRSAILDKPAVGRFIKHALAGNEAHDRRRAQQQADEKARTHIRFQQSSSKPEGDGAAKSGSRTKAQNVDTKSSPVSAPEFSRSPAVSKADQATSVPEPVAEESSPEPLNAHNDENNSKGSERKKKRKKGSKKEQRAKRLKFDGAGERRDEGH